jgi:hypothetical protein
LADDLEISHQKHENAEYPNRHFLFNGLKQAVASRAEIGAVSISGLKNHGLTHRALHRHIPLLFPLAPNAKLLRQRETAFRQIKYMSYYAVGRYNPFHFAKGRGKTRKNNKVLYGSPI